MSGGDNYYGNEKSHNIAYLRDLIKSNFPRVPFLGAVTPADGHSRELFGEDDEWWQILHALSGRSWDDISAEFIRLHPDALALLTEDAFVAFVPAWLLSSLEIAEKSVGENLIYFFSPRQDMIPDTTAFIIKRLQRLTQGQRGTVVMILRYLVLVEISSFLRHLAENALFLIETFRRESNDIITGSV